MSFLLLPPELNSARIFAGAGSEPLVALTSAWQGIGAELAEAADGFSALTTELPAEVWKGPASAAMSEATGSYTNWLRAAAAEAQTAAEQGRAALAAFEAARSTMVNPAVVAQNRDQLVALVRSNLLGFNAPAIAATEASYGEMWEQAATVMVDYHTGAAAAVAQLGSWGAPLPAIAGLVGQLAGAVADAAVGVQQQVTQVAGVLTEMVSHAVASVSLGLFGTPTGVPVPATGNPNFSGAPSLFSRVETQIARFAQAVGNFFNPNGTAGQGSSPFSSTSPPSLLTWLLGEHVTNSTYNGMNVVQIAPSNPSSHYVVAVHGGSYELQPSIFNWIDYSLMAHQTGATVEVPLYPLINQGGTAGVVVPLMASFLSSQIAAHSAPMVSVYGDSAGGGLALASVEYLVANHSPVPASMVLLSPWLDVGMTNPNISLVSDPVLNFASLQQAGRAWAGGLSVNNPLASPLYGSLQGLPPTYVYSGSLDMLAPDVLVLAHNAAMVNAPISFVLRAGEIHDWAVAGFGDAAGYRPQIYQQLGI